MLQLIKSYRFTSAPLLAAPSSALLNSLPHRPFTRALPKNPIIFIDKFSVAFAYLNVGVSSSLCHVKIPTHPRSGSRYWPTFLVSSPRSRRRNVPSKSPGVVTNSGYCGTGRPYGTCPYSVGGALHWYYFPSPHRRRPHRRCCRIQCISRSAGGHRHPHLHLVESPCFAWRPSSIGGAALGAGLSLWSRDELRASLHRRLLRRGLGVASDF